ncbi:MAG: hypothetical protein GXN99_02945 [Candidatus Nanohaloarchaeota archaeon]|nr:hypothetical protein [Candidatus Nanohaloarchaeota archaeon]
MQKIKMWLLFEVQASDKELTLKAMNKHLHNLMNEKGVKVEEVKIEDKVDEVDAPPNIQEKGIKNLYSCFGEAVIEVNGLGEAVRIITNYAPSSIEVLSPERYELELKDMQELLINISDFVHKMFSQGMGGIVIRM